MLAKMMMMEVTLLLQKMNLAELHALASFSGLHIPLSLRVSPRALPLQKKGSRFRRLNLLLFIKVKTRIISKMIKINTRQVKSKAGRQSRMCSKAFIIRIVHSRNSRSWWQREIMKSRAGRYSARAPTRRNCSERITPATGSCSFYFILPRRSSARSSSSSFSKQSAKGVSQKSRNTRSERATFPQCCSS